ncbi:hypothetical protein [Hymenobacter sediminicola]|uniref:Uncharacterized protein n=1 Tax=Hymenobacter sediminicola TaxID=2761579 RepID=A0A7G7W4F9_9BACT|nr:hypothetical protein [Hymenobacter sediminicola]QNH61252.1 hypothetical protein H4317_13900 [Hymenobacter sediminicola]
MRVSTPSTFHRLTSTLRAAGLALALLLLAPLCAQAQTWMVSTDAYIKMGVMDKFGQLGTYSAKFVVTDQTSGKAYILVKEVGAGQNGVDVIFPSEPSEPDYFKTETGEAAKSQPGRYTWECQVSGKKVVGGRFTLPETANDITVLEKQEKKK